MTLAVLDNYVIFYYGTVNRLKRNHLSGAYVTNERYLKIIYKLRNTDDGRFTNNDTMFYL